MALVKLGLERKEAMALRSVLEGRSEEISINVHHRLGVQLDRVWNPDADQAATCECGHPYHRHFDGYDDMAPVGCKYCSCSQFIEN